MATLVADVGDHNVWEIDLDIPIDAGNDKLWFTAKKRISDADADAPIRKGKNVVGLGGITVTDPATGKFQVVADPADTEDLTDEALIWDVQVRQAASGRTTSVQRGVMRLRKGVTQATT